MDFTRRLRRFRAFGDSPRANFGSTRRKERNKSEQTITRLDYTGKSRAFKVHIGKEEFLVLVGHIGDIRLDFRANRQHFRVFLFRDTNNRLIFLVVVYVARKIRLRHIRRVNNGLVGEQGRIFKHCALFIGIVKAARGFSAFKVSFQSLKEVNLRLRRLVAFESFFRAVYAAFQNLQIGENKFEIYRFNISCRAD